MAKSNRNNPDRPSEKPMQQGLPANKTTATAKDLAAEANNAERVAIAGDADYDPFADGSVSSGAHEIVGTQTLGNTIISLPEGATRGDAIRVLNKAIPQNEYKLPTFFYRSDLLPYNLGALTQDDADMAVVNLEFYEGYPTFDGGHIFWQQLPHEPLDDFLLFQRYLDQAEQLGLRQLQIFCMEEHKAHSAVYSKASEFYWNERARAYDLFQIAAERKRREIRSRKTENKHFATAENLVAQLLTKFTGSWLDDLTPKEAIDALERMMKIQRMSLGLAANGNMGVKDHDPMAAGTGADLMREITQNTGGAAEGGGLNDTLMSLLRDPNFALKAQSLVLEVRHKDVEIHSGSEQGQGQGGPIIVQENNQPTVE